MSNLRKKLAELYNGYDHEKEYIDAYKNPTLEEIQQLGNFIRGIVDSNGNICLE